MKQRHLPIAATLTIASLVAICGAARAQEDPYRALRSYDFQERASLAAIQQEIVAARGVASKLDPIEAKLIAVLTDAGAKFGGKQEACKFLGSIGTARSVPALSRMLSGDARQADAARYALERIAAPEAAKALRSALASAKGGVLAGIVNSLGARKDAAAVAPLRKLAASADPAVRSAAVEALGHIGTQPALAALQRLPKPDARAYDAMLRCADALAGAGKGAMAEPVYVGLTAKGKPAFVRVTAMRGLAAMKSAKAGAAALGAINDPDVYVQRGAGRVVAQSADPGVTRKAAAALASAPPDAQIVLLTGWADRREPLAAAAALKLTASDVPEVRAAAIRASGRTGGVGSVKALAGIAARGGDDAGIAREALAEMPGKPAAEAILRLSRDGKPEVRAAMMAVIGERPGASSMAALIAGARDPGAPIAVAALRALAGVGGAAEVAPLAAVLVGTASDEIREAAGGAVTACVQRSGQRDLAVTPVLQAIAGAATQPRCALLGVLAEIGGDKALGELTRATASDDPDVKRAAVKGLADTWTDSAPTPILLRLAKEDASASIRVMALRGYIRLVGQDGGMQADAKVAALEQAIAAARRPDEKRQAFGALRDCRTEKAVTLLSLHIGDADLGPEAAEAILDLAAPQKRNNRDLPAVKGAAVTAALDAIVAGVADEALKERARKLK